MYKKKKRKKEEEENDFVKNSQGSNLYLVILSSWHFSYIFVIFEFFALKMLLI